jgi:hypothetical protein
MADSMTKQMMDPILQFKEELEKAMEVFRAVPAPAVLSSEEGAARSRLEKALWRLHLVLIAAPAGAGVIPPVLH